MSKYDQRTGKTPIYNNQNFPGFTSTAGNVVKFDTLKSVTNNIDIRGTYKVNGTQISRVNVAIGISTEDTNLGPFTGEIIGSNQTVKEEGMQDLETEIDLVN